MQNTIVSTGKKDISLARYLGHVKYSPREYVQWIQIPVGSVKEESHFRKKQTNKQMKNILRNTWLGRGKEGIGVS